MTKANKKNILVWIGVSLGFVTLFGTSFAIYFSAGELKKITDKKEYVLRNNLPLTIDGYFFDSTASYGSVATGKETKAVTIASLIRIETIGETKFEQTANNELIVSESSKSKLVLDLGKEIVLTFSNATGETKQVIFNSDEAEIDPSASIPKKPEIVELKSANTKSINSTYFDSLLLHGEADLDANGSLVANTDQNVTGAFSLKSVGFTVKDDIFWVDSNGNKTNYKISPRDFYYSYMRTWLFDRKFRHQNGGSALLDKYFINKTSTITRFLEDGRYPNDYLMSLFGIDSTSLRSEEKTILDVNVDGVNKKMFSVHVMEGAETVSFLDLINKTFLNSYLFSAAPSEFIDALVAKDKGIKYPVSDNQSEEITGLAEKFGIYTYGQKRTDNLFASHYIPTSSENGRITFEKNKFFSNKNFVNEINTLEKIIFQYSTSSNFEEQLFNNYFEGTVSEMPYSSLNQQQKIKIFGSDGNSQFAKEKGLLQVKQLNKSTLVQRTLLATDPRKFNDGEKGNYFFNEEYSKMIYGSTINELKEGIANTAPSFFNGPGFELRTLFNASINWYTFIENTSKGLKKLWLNHTAPNAKFNNSTNETPIDYIQQINNIGYFNGNTKVTITEEEMRNNFLNNASSIEEQYKTHKFDEIKMKVELLLDSQNITSPLEWAIVYPFDNRDEAIINELNFIQKTLSKLDSKGRIKPYIYVPNNREQMLNSINQNLSISDFNGWGYDYEGIGSYLDGISHGYGISLLGAFSLYSNPLNTAIRTQSPEFTRLSDRIKSKLNPSLPIGLKVEDWVNFTNNDNNNIDTVFSEKGYKFGSEIAKFFLSYQEEISTTQIVDLIIELNLISGFSMESDISILDPNSTSLSLVLPEYFYPTTKSGSLSFSDIRLGDKNV